MCIRDRSVNALQGGVSLFFGNSYEEVRGKEWRKEEKQTPDKFTLTEVRTVKKGHSLFFSVRAVELDAFRSGEMKTGLNQSTTGVYRIHVMLFSKSTNLGNAIVSPGFDRKITCKRHHEGHDTEEEIDCTWPEARLPGVTYNVYVSADPLVQDKTKENILKKSQSMPVKKIVDVPNVDIILQQSDMTTNKIKLKKAPPVFFIVVEAVTRDFEGNSFLIVDYNVLGFGTSETEHGAKRVDGGNGYHIMGPIYAVLFVAILYCGFKTIQEGIKEQN
eukprot:TRINITY_DN2058_c0_g2_i8.p2 TRINITY_DN2058_c0_g2~~TRINITY_DN2058_c0_g2_i8.p2  ORF type:complete len:274 (+),score=54.50 TRINITY_DN2058_c0_g2_i8:65-886(+)